MSLEINLKIKKELHNEILDTLQEFIKDNRSKEFVLELQDKNILLKSKYDEIEFSSLDEMCKNIVKKIPKEAFIGSVRKNNPIEHEIAILRYIKEELCIEYYKEDMFVYDVHHP